MIETEREPSGTRRVQPLAVVAYALLVVAVAGLVASLIVVRFTRGVAYHDPPLMKDPERTIPPGNTIVSPADGTVLYVRRIENGVIPEVVKRGVPIPIAEHIKIDPIRPFGNGYLIGIYMHTLGVHVNRIPIDGVVKKRVVYNGPHMNMTAAETTIGLTQSIPGLVTLKKFLGMAPFNLEDKADFVLKSARETLVLADSRGTLMYIVRIADYYVGNILTWVKEGEKVSRGQKMGMITWGSQTDVFIQDSPGLEVHVDGGQYVYGAQTILATY